MKIFSKRIITVVVACMMACLMSVTPALAAGSFTKTTVKLNAYSGGSSTKSTVTSGTVGDNQSVTKVELRCTVSAGSDPYTLYVKSPEGSTESLLLVRFRLILLLQLHLMVKTHMVHGQYGL